MAEAVVLDVDYLYMAETVPEVLSGASNHVSLETPERQLIWRRPDRRLFADAERRSACSCGNVLVNAALYEDERSFRDRPHRLHLVCEFKTGCGLSGSVTADLATIR